MTLREQLNYCPIPGLTKKDIFKINWIIIGKSSLSVKDFWDELKRQNLYLKNSLAKIESIVKSMSSLLGL